MYVLPMYYNIFTGWFVALMSLLIGISLLPRRKNREILFFAGFWIFSGITFFANQLNEFFWLLVGAVPNNILHPVNQISIALQGVFLFSFVLLQLTKNLSLTKKLLIPPVILIIIFLYFNQTKVYDGPVITEWSVEFYPTTFSAQFSFLFTIGIGFVLVAANLIRELYRKSKHLTFNLNLFLANLAIFIYMAGGALDELGIASGAKSLVIRGIILIGALAAYFAYREKASPASNS